MQDPTFGTSNSDGFQVSVSSLTLGTLYEAIIAFSSQDRFETFWPAVCQNARWLMPSRRMCIVLHMRDDVYEIIGQFEQGKFQKPEDVQCELCEKNLGQMLTRRSAQWVSKPGEQIDIQSDKLASWLLHDQPDTLLVLPIHLQGEPLGAILFGMGPVEQADRTMLTALGTVYALHVGMAYMLILAKEERRRQEEELELTRHELSDTQRQLVESEKMAALGSLVAGIAHEINTPVGIGVTAASHLETRNRDFSQLYEQGKMKRSDLDKFLDTVKQSSDLLLSNLNRAAGIIGSFKQVAVDQSSEERRVFQVREYLDEILLSLQPALKKNRHHVEVRCEEEVELDSYPGAFSQIVTNLVMNSLLHAYETDEEGHLIFELKRVSERFIFKYSDDGKGISEEHLSKIFEPFFTTKRNQGGSGLGMHIVYNLVTQRLQGKLDVKSQVGHGITFTIDLPILQPKVS